MPDNTRASCAACRQVCRPACRPVCRIACPNARRMNRRQDVCRPRVRQAACPPAAVPLNVSRPNPALQSAWDHPGAGRRSASLRRQKIWAARSHRRRFCRRPVWSDRRDRSQSRNLNPNRTDSRDGPDDPPPQDDLGAPDSRNLILLARRRCCGMGGADQNYDHDHGRAAGRSLSP